MWLLLYLFSLIFIFFGEANSHTLFCFVFVLHSWTFCHSLTVFCLRYLDSSICSVFFFFNMLFLWCHAHQCQINCSDLYDAIIPFALTVSTGVSNIAVLYPPCLSLNFHLFLPVFFLKRHLNQCFYILLRKLYKFDLFCRVEYCHFLKMFVKKLAFWGGGGLFSKYHPSHHKQSFLLIGPQELLYWFHCTNHLEISSISVSIIYVFIHAVFYFSLKNFLGFEREGVIIYLLYKSVTDKAAIYNFPYKK